MTDKIRQIVKEHARLSIEVDSLGEDGDLYKAGMSSHASVNLMLALEGAFEVEFPDRMLKRRVFESVASIRSAIEELQAEATRS
jgi:acyl carrier protein